MVYEENSLLTQRKERRRVVQIPFQMVADTLQRMVFYKSAIRSNENSILLFEEPEAHSYPPYIQDLAHEIIRSDSNQFFIATHSPYILNTMLEFTAIDELAVFHVDYEDHQTVARRIPDEELEELMDHGYDLFAYISRPLDEQRSDS